jgi:FeS assembly SUF system protein
MTEATQQPSKTSAELRTDIISVLKTCYDPEIPVDIYELGLVYEINVDPGNNVKILMTLTSPSCPVAETLPPEVEQKIRGIEGVQDVKLELTWDPPWTQELMSEVAKLELGFL